MGRNDTGFRIPVGDSLFFREDYVVAPDHFLLGYVSQPVTKSIIAISKEYAWPHFRVQFPPFVLCNMHIGKTAKHLQVLVQDVFAGPHSYHVAVISASGQNVFPCASILQTLSMMVRFILSARPFSSGVFGTMYSRRIPFDR